MSDAVIDESTLEHLHHQVVEELRVLTRTSESAVLVAGSSLSDIVGEGRRLAEQSQERVDAIRRDHDAHLPGLLERVDVRIESFVDTVVKGLDEDDTAVQAAQEDLDVIAAAAARLDAIAGASRVLAVCAQIETAQLDSDGSRERFAATVGEMRKLASLVARLHTDLGTRVVALQELLQSLSEGSEELREALGRDRERLAHRSAEVHRQSAEMLAGLDGVSGEAIRTAEDLLSNSQEGLSALQFQDPMIQELQRLDALIGSLLTTEEEDPDADSPLQFAVNLGDRTSQTPNHEEDGDDAALDAGELLLF